jgi:hypothetical protein
MARFALCIAILSLASEAGAQTFSTLPETTGVGVALLGLGLLGAFGLLLFWALPITVAALIAMRRQEEPVAAVLWAGLLGWIGVLYFLYRRAAKPCPHCRTQIVAEAGLCYWCGGETRPAPLPDALRAEW